MHFVGFFLVIFLFITGFSIAEFAFYTMTGRGLWRAIIPTKLRFMILKNDKVEMDSFMIMEELAAIIFTFSMLLLPMIALHFTGFI